MKANEIESFCPASRAEWRKWLQKNHEKKDAVWLIAYKKESGKPTLPWSDAVDEALCFGWIDSIRKTIDQDKFMQRFSKRKPRSTWSKINKQKVKRLTKEGLMSPAGLEVIEVAKQNGSWTILDEVEELIIPKDLEAAFKKKRGARKQFITLSRSQKRLLLLGLVMTKTAGTRVKRIQEIISKCSPT